jgi:hypothetical protein
MRKFKFVVVFAALAALMSCGSVTGTEADLDGQALNNAYVSGLPAVELINAKVTINKGGDLSGAYQTKIAGDIEVENIAYHKSVKVVYSLNGGEWKELSASYKKSLGNNREHWTFSEAIATHSQGGDPRAGYSGPESTVQFAVKYEVNGQVFWDNNGGAGQDYRMTSLSGYGDAPYGPAVFGKQDVVLEYTTYSGYPSTYLRGNVAVKKVNGQVGTVTIVFTTDGWNTVQTLTASGSRGSWADQEVLSFMGTYYGNVDIEFAISHDVNGQSLWDNNVGDNYNVGVGYSAPF